MQDRVKIGILGASGYTGAELLRLLHGHPYVEIVFLTANRHAGQAMASVFPHLLGIPLPLLVREEDADIDAADVIFCALPHGMTQTTIAAALQRAPTKKVIDLSADFRLIDPAAYHTWYCHEHQAPALQREAVYGLTEVHRTAIAAARLIANPGCYTTTALLPLIPLTAAGLIEADGLVIDAKSGVSGAGREAKQETLFTETAEGLRAYGVAGHRHVAEIEQELSRASGGAAVTVSFTPHLIPMNRGILVTCYATLSPGTSIAALRACLEDQYGDEPFVHLVPIDRFPSTRDTRGTNQCRIGVYADRVAGRAIIIAVTDNLVKGASGQAVQNMNLMCGIPEITGLRVLALFP